MQIMANEKLELETRLYVMANLAHKISDFYHRGCDKPDKGQLETVLKNLSKDEVVLKLATLIKEYDANSPLSMIIVHSILSIKLQQANEENISQLYEKIIKKYTEQKDNVAEVLAAELIKICSRLDLKSKQYIDKAVTRYILNCLYREWFVTMPDPFTYIQMLLVRTSILRTLIYLDIGEEKLEQHQFKQQIVYVMYNFARNIDQNLDFLKVIYNALSEQTMMNFDFSPAFIRMC